MYILKLYIYDFRLNKSDDEFLCQAIYNVYVEYNRIK